MSTNPRAYHRSLVDFRTFLNGGDDADCIHVGLGGECLDREVLRFRWEGSGDSGALVVRFYRRTLAGWGTAEDGDCIHMT